MTPEMRETLRRAIHTRVYMAGDKAMREERARIMSEFDELMEASAPEASPPAIPAPGVWRPIDEHPRDGDWFLARFSDGDVRRTRWSKEKLGLEDMYHGLYDAGVFLHWSPLPVMP